MWSSPVRFLHLGHAHGRQGAARRGAGADGRARRRVPAREPLPVHGLSQGHRRRGGVRATEGGHVTRRERIVGTSGRRVDALEKVTGRARYVTDLDRPGMLHAKILRSPYAHARVVRIETATARALAGVRAVVTSADLGWCEPYFGPAYRDRPVLAIGVARYEGEPVAAVVADDESVAVQALDLIDVEYEELAAVTTLEEALAPGAPLVHTSKPLAGHFADLSSLRPKPGTNICHQFDFERGCGAAGFAEADLVAEHTYT